MKNNSSDQNCTHVIQKTGLLKNFSIVKTITMKELEKMKEEARKQSTGDAQYNEILAKKLIAVRNMHDPKNPIPGIIYKVPPDERKSDLMDIAVDMIEGLKKDKMTHSDFAFFVSVLITKLKLTREDFKAISDEDAGEFADEDDDDEDDSEF